MSGLLSNARRAFLRPANTRDYTRTDSRIIGATLPVTIASTLFRHRIFYICSFMLLSSCTILHHLPHGAA